MSYCEQCGSTTLISLGVLGDLEHFRCRDCGWEQSESYTVEDVEGNLDDWDEGYPYNCHDMSDDAEVLASAGMGTDEDYGCFNQEDW